MDYKKFAEEVCSGVEDLCVGTQVQYGTELKDATRDFLESSMPRIKDWKEACDAGKMSREDFDLALKGRLNVFGLGGLAEIAEIREELMDFKEKLHGLIVNVLFGNLK
jgi:hypothetical protein